MDILLENASKHFNYHWIFKGLNHNFLGGNRYALTGPNGSGKSTLLRCLSTFFMLSEGSLNFVQDQKTLDKDKIFEISQYSAPYLKLPENISVKEFIDFHSSFKPYSGFNSTQEILDEIRLDKHRHKHIDELSSGMKQRLILSLAFCFDNQVLFFDEPVSHLDDKNYEWFKSHFENIGSEILVFVASNEPKEIELCSHKLDMKTQQEIITL